MWLKPLSVEIAPPCSIDRDGKTCLRTWGKLAMAAAGFFMGLALATALLLPRESLAGDLPRQPVRVSMWLDRDACAVKPEFLQLSLDVALGLVAFNSPYLFGGKALRSQLTCGACHAKEGPSGAAVRLRLRAPVPDLRLAAAHVDVAAFVDHAVVAEFDGPPLPQRTARALAALTGELAPFSSDGAGMCRIDAASLVAIGLRLAVARVGASDTGADELNFLLDSLRFVLGEMARDTPPDVPADLLHEANRSLQDAMQSVDHENRSVALATMQGLAERWEAASSPRPRFVIASGPVHDNE